MNEHLDFKGRTVLVVGGTSGIGNGIAQAFRSAGAAVHVWGTRASAGDYRASEGSDLEGLHFDSVDVSDAQAIRAYRPPFDRLDALVLAQGAVEYRRAEFDDTAFRRVVDVNLNSLMSCASHFHSVLKAARGALIIISSTSAYRAAIGTPAYAASKAAAVSLTRSLGAAWIGDGIRVNGIAPGLVATKMTAITTEHPQRLQATLARIPAGRIGTPQDMAGVALFLASPLAAYVVGHTIPVDGGLSA
jgi:3-oxoacyl-[acyl-carrier protein] reductase